MLCILQAYTTCPFGIHYVGYMTSVLLVVRAAVAFLGGWISQYVDTNAQLSLAALAQVSNVTMKMSIMIMIFCERSNHVLATIYDREQPHFECHLTTVI